MRNFIIFFNGREGTSPLVRLLNNFESVNIVHQIDDKGWEPFDFHNCGPMSTKDLDSCFELIYGNNPFDMERLNKVYTKTATNPLEVIDNKKSIGFKMRFRHPINLKPMESKIPISLKYLNLTIRRYNQLRFEKLIFGILKKQHIVTFIAIRQNAFRLALSEYHGDGYGNRGHLQFKLASGEITKNDIPKIRVDCNRLETLILKWERAIQRKKILLEKLERSGIENQSLIYETFCDDKQKYFLELFNKLNIEVSKKDIETAIRAGAIFEKVHSDDISDFVINHEEVLDRFGDR